MPVIVAAVTSLGPLRPEDTARAIAAAVTFLAAIATTTADTRAPPSATFQGEALTMALEAADFAIQLKRISGLH